MYTLDHVKRMSAIGAQPKYSERLLRKGLRVLADLKENPDTYSEEYKKEAWEATLYVADLVLEKLLPAWASELESKPGLYELKEDYTACIFLCNGMLEGLRGDPRYPKYQKKIVNAAILLQKTGTEHGQEAR